MSARCWGGVSVRLWAGLSGTLRPWERTGSSRNANVWKRPMASGFRLRISKVLFQVQNGKRRRDANDFRVSTDDRCGLGAKHRGAPQNDRRCSGEPRDGNPDVSALQPAGDLSGAAVVGSRTGYKGRGCAGQSGFSGRFGGVPSLVLVATGAGTGQVPMGHYRHRARPGAAAWAETRHAPDAVRPEQSPAPVVSKLGRAAG